MWNIIWTIAGVVTVNVVCLIYIFRTYMPSMLQSVLTSVGEDIGSQLQDTFATPNVKKAFTILGKQSGDVRAVKAVKNEVGRAIIDNMGPIRMVADYLGFDIDGMVEQYGADTVISALSQFQPLIDQFTGKIAAALPGGTAKTEGKLP